MKPVSQIGKITAEQLLKTDGIITASPDSTLAQALNKLTSSHDAVFITQGKQLLGVISPYYTLFHSNYPQETKVKHCLFSPPKLRLHSRLPEIARKMVDSKVYFLPVFADNGDWVGIVTKRRILKLLSQQPLDDKDFAALLKPKTMVTIKADDTIGHARSLIKQSGVSRLLVVDSRGALKGILSRHDLRLAVSDSASSRGQLSRGGEKIRNSDQPIRPHIKTTVVNVPAGAGITSIIKLMTQEVIGSVALINKWYQPVAIVTIRDLLEYLTRLAPAPRPTSFTVDPDFPYRPAVVALAGAKIRKLQRKFPLKDVKFRLLVNKNASGGPTRYQVSLTAVHPKQGELTVKIEDHLWKIAVQTAVKTLAAQIRPRAK